MIKFVWRDRANNRPGRTSDGNRVIGGARVDDYELNIFPARLCPKASDHLFEQVSTVLRGNNQRAAIVMAIAKCWSQWLIGKFRLKLLKDDVMMSDGSAGPLPQTPIPAQWRKQSPNGR